MTPSRYCEPADLYDYGLPRGTVPNPGRLVRRVNVSANTLELDVHGFSSSTVIQFKGEAGGDVPGGLSEDASYYALPVTESSFQVAATEGGPAIDLTDAGDAFSVGTALPFDAAIERASAHVDDMIVAHAVPMTAPYPVTVVAVTADLAAWFLLNGIGASTPGLDAKLLAAQKILDRWTRGVPVRGANVPVATNLAVSGSSSGDPRGWVPSGGGIP